MDEVVKVSGYVEKIVYRNENNGYTVLTMSEADSGEDMSLTGTFSYIAEGQFLEVTGNATVHRDYGPQINVTEYVLKDPSDTTSMEKYLGSGAIKGVGPALAARIVTMFKEDTFKIIEETPEKLVKVKGISKKGARKIAEQFMNDRKMRSAMMFLQKYNIPMNLAVKVYKYYGEKMYKVLEDNPYRLAEDIFGVGFKTADNIASSMGISGDSNFRISAGLKYTLSLAGNNGHCYLPMEGLIQETVRLLGVNEEIVRREALNLLLDKDFILEEKGEDKNVYLASMYYMEAGCARMLNDLNIRFSADTEGLEKEIEKIEKEDSIELDDIQKNAIIEAAQSGVMIITGGPGTGKTTTINTIIKIFEKEGMDFLLAAPTGRAAKRMTEATGYEAQTIHRLLEVNGMTEDGVERDGTIFSRNETNPLECDVVIIDEMSMVDIYLMNALLKALTPGVRLIMVGDASQLPSVGPGNVLKDMINADFCTVVRLKKIFRQAAQSDIIMNAHAINNGEKIKMDNKSKDFFFLKRDDPNTILQLVVHLVMKSMPEYVKADPYDVQVLTPMRKGELGVENLNKVLQRFLNPEEFGKVEREFHGVLFREGDKIMQIKNNYNITWEKRLGKGFIEEEGKGVFNGDCGIIKRIDNDGEKVVVQFEDNKIVDYDFSDMNEIELSYAITIHKSQGSEYPAVVIPIFSGPPILFNRNLLYTAITRARQCVTIAGSREKLEFMIGNKVESKRYSGLCERIKEQLI
ncbi:MAG: ATP-dependent RecD-like DNA helicase [Lachnospiraceae bacterium]|nr:ATP-dependent RecD-like DNA helicase [Lachnospiraceae bacterium]